MNWICPRCAEELGELNAWCEYCKVEDEKIIYNPDKYYIRDIRIRHIVEGSEPMTPQEELFAKLFNHEKVLVKDMDILTLRAHREELTKIAFEARARLTAVDDEEVDRKKKSAPKGPTGFSHSVNTDETTTNAINTIKERQKRLTKAEKIQAGLEKLGISSTDAAKMMTAGTILGQIKSKATADKFIAEGSDKPSEESKPVFNPFAKKEE